jgi:hypothetical protein
MLSRPSLTDVCVCGDEFPEALGNQQAVDAVEDGGHAHGFPPQRRGEGVDVTQLGDEDLLLLETLLASAPRLCRAGGQSNTYNTPWTRLILHQKTPRITLDALLANLWVPGKSNEK